MYISIEIPAAAIAIGNWVTTWSIRSAPHASDERIVVSEIGEHWSLYRIDRGKKGVSE